MHPATRLVSPRDRYNAFIERHDVAWELTMAVLAIIWVAIGFAIDQVGIGVRPELEGLEIALTIVFIAEFSSRLYAAHDRRQYLRGHWIDGIALLPPVRFLRAFRLLRLLRLIRAFAGVYRAGLCTIRGWLATVASPGSSSPGSRSW